MRQTAHLAATLLLAATATSAAPYRVGAGCTYPDIATALKQTLGQPDTVLQLVQGVGDSAQQIVIDGRDVTLVGGFADCTSATPAGHTLLNGSGGSRTSVLSIRGGADVRLERLQIAFGDDTDDENEGGGIDFRGVGTLDLVDTQVFRNRARYGGGIQFNGTLGPSLLRLHAGTRVYDNTASVSGGGIRIEGDARLEMVAVQTGIFGNLAEDGYGGGIEVLGPASADIGSPGYDRNGERMPAIHDNLAQYGGGIAAAALGDQRHVRVRLFGTDPAHPVWLRGNRAQRSGGALWLKPNGDFFGNADAAACLYDFRLQGNSAQEGSAIYADVDGTAGIEQGATVLLNALERCGAGALAAMGARRCSPGPGCNSIDGNLARDRNNVPTAGASILVQTNSEFSGTRVQFRGNTGAHVLRSVDGYLFDMRACLISDNTVTGELIRASGSTPISLRGCTLAHNSIGGSVAIHADDGIDLTESILHEPGVALLGGGGTRNVRYVVASERATLDGGSSVYVTEADPRFIDPGHGDYTLQAASPAIDAAPAGIGVTEDLQRAQRDRDIAAVVDLYGPRDLGAFERQTLGNLVLNPGFPDRIDPLRLWLPATTAAATAWSSESATGGPGAVYVRFDPDITPEGKNAKGVVGYVGLQQCIHLPAPGVYALNGSSRAPGNLQQRDYAGLRWSYRADADDCQGTPHELGTHYLPRGGTFAAGPAPAQFLVPESEWTTNSTLFVAMEVFEGDIIGGNAVDAYFDDITLLLMGQPPVSFPIFSDGFE